MNIIKYLIVISGIMLIFVSCRDEKDNSDLEPDEKYYTNPFFLPNQSKHIGAGDPATIRWMGKYYLTVSRNPLDAGIMMWESENLVDWEYLGIISDAPEVNDAWAPEVFYYEGAFYMYTSGPDNNHRVLKLETSKQDKPSPFGEYTVVSTNMFPGADHDIDATPFRDDNGDLYFLFSGGGGIQYIKTNSPVDGDKPVHKLRRCFVKVPEDDRGSTWTEGPSVIKKNGIYYMTYCGNDVIRVDYQVHAASGSSIEALTPVSHNPILKHTEGFSNGTGHSHNVLGPDLKTYYTTYHVKIYEGNLAETGLPLYRYTMLNKIEFHPDGDVTSEVTFDEQPVPKMAEWSDGFNRDFIGDEWAVTGDWSMNNNFAVTGTGNGSSLLSTKKTSENEFVVEGYVKVKPGSTGGIVTDNGELKALLDYDKKQLIIMQKQGVSNVDIPDSNFDVWHQIKISLKDGNVIVWFDNMKKFQDSYSEAGKSNVGYYVEKGNVDFAWIAFSSY